MRIGVFPLKNRVDLVANIQTDRIHRDAKHQPKKNIIFKTDSRFALAYLLEGIVFNFH